MSAKLEHLPETFVKGFHDLEAVLKCPYRKFGKTELKIFLITSGSFVHVNEEWVFCCDVRKSEQKLFIFIVAFSVSALSFGCAPLGLTGYGTIDQKTATSLLRKAIKNGINFIDTAYWYGQGNSEKVLSIALSEVPRSAYYISDKVGRYESEPSKMMDFSAQRTLRAVDEALARLRLPYVDLMNLHDIDLAPNPEIVLTEALPALQKAKEAGKVRFIGITGYSLRCLKHVLEKSTVQIDSVLTYCRCTLFDDSASEYIPFFAEKGVGLINAAVNGIGLLTRANSPPVWHPASTDLKKACSDAANWCDAQGVDLGRLAVDYGLQYPGFATTLCGINNDEILDADLDILWNGLSPLEQKVKQEVIAKFFSNRRLLVREYGEERPGLVRWTV